MLNITRNKLIEKSNETEMNVAFVMIRRDVLYSQVGSCPKPKEVF